MEIQKHSTSLALLEPVPGQVDAGSELVVKIQVVCAECDLQTFQVRIVDAKGTIIKETELASPEDASNEIHELTVQAANIPGEYAWTLVFPTQELQGALHEEISVPVAFTVKPHATSIAVWDVASPIELNSKFKIMVGVQCRAGCKLARQAIEILDHVGKRVTTAALGDVPLSSTGALYWTEVALQAPGAIGNFDWTVKFSQQDVEPAHAASSYPFSFATVQPPDHVVTVTVVDKQDKTPMANALVLLHPFRGYTDENGVARIGVLKGEYDLRVAKIVKYNSWVTHIMIDRDLVVRAELSLEPIDPS